MGAALGSAGFAGCASFVGDRRDDPPPIDVDEATLQAIAAIDRPAEADEVPVGVADEHVEGGTQRVAALLDEVPSDLAAEIPNEAVRTYIEDERADARDRLERVDDAATNYDRLSPLHDARRHAAAAEGAHAAATDGRTREAVVEEGERVRSDLSTVEENLSRTGDDLHHALAVYAAVEWHLDRSGRALEAIDDVPTRISEVEAVGEIADHVEWARASLGDATHLLDRHTAAAGDDRSFDDQFQTTAADRLDDLGEQVNDLPSEPADLFDAPVDGTPRDPVAGAAISRIRASYHHATNHFGDGWIARALVGAYGVDHDLRAVEHLQSIVTDGGLDRPADATDIRRAKEDAVAAIESIRAAADHPYLVARRLNVAIARVRSGDRTIDRQSSDRPESSAMRANALYAFAEARARTLPDATERLLVALS